jgi:hypothetical protein
MNIQCPVWLTVGLMAAPIAATAQVTTLSYEGDLMTGTSSYLPTGLVVPTDFSMATLPTAPVSGEFTASIEVSGSLAANNLRLISYGVTFNGSSTHHAGADNELRRFATSSNFRSTACIPF